MNITIIQDNSDVPLLTLFAPPTKEKRSAYYDLLQCLIEMNISLQDQTIAFSNLAAEAANDQSKFNSDYQKILAQDVQNITNAANESDPNKRNADVAKAQAQYNNDQAIAAAQNDRYSTVTQDSQNEVKSMASAQQQDDQNNQGAIQAVAFWAQLLQKSS